MNNYPYCNLCGRKHKVTAKMLELDAMLMGYEKNINKGKGINRLWDEMKKSLSLVFLSCYLLLSVSLVVVPMFGIAALVDSYSCWMLLLYIPWAMTLTIAGKPLSLFFEP